ncbi:hypothetical protein AB0425_17355 [Actinosynnema sp. NPDC051121]
MPIPDTLTKIRIAGDIRHPLSGTPGTGTVEIVFGYTVRDTANNVIFAPGAVTAAVTAGTFLTAEMVNPRQAGISPANQPLTVRILTDVYADEYQIEIPADATGTLQLADLAPAENPPAVVTYALASALAAYLIKAGDTMTGALLLAADPTADMQAATKRYVDAAAATGGVPNATTSAVGLVQLAGDLAGTATAPTVPGLAQRQPLDTDLTTFAALAPADDTLLQRKAGAWTARTPVQVKTDLGLDQVNNTADVNKPISTAAQTALDGKNARVVVRRARITSGNVTPANTAGGWTILAGFELAIPAAVGDDVEVSVHAMRTNTENLFLDVAVVVGSTVVRYLATDTNTPAVEGDPGWYPGAPGTHYPTQSGPRSFDVTADDLDAGQVRFVVVVKSGGAGTVYASTDFPFYWQARNWGNTA